MTVNEMTVARNILASSCSREEEQSHKIYKTNNEQRNIEPGRNKDDEKQSRRTTIAYGEWKKKGT